MQIKTRNFLLAWTFLLPGIVCISFDEFMTLTVPQKQALDKIKQSLEDVPYEYMKYDFFLIRILRGTNFDVPAAQGRLREIIRWRKENNIDHILEEDFSDVADEVDAQIQGCDKELRPVISVNVGEIDVRRLVLSGKQDRLIRWGDRLFESARLMLTTMMEQGQNVTHVVIIFDAEGFSPTVHGIRCFQCMRAYFQFFRRGYTHLRGYIHKIHIVNAPSSVIQTWNIVKSLLPSTSRFHFYGKDKENWQRILFKEIDPSQLSKEFGGMKAEVIQGSQLLKSGTVFRCNMTYADLLSKITRRASSSISHQPIVRPT